MGTLLWGEFLLKLIDRSHKKVLQRFKGAVWHFGRYASLWSCKELDEKIDTILMFLLKVWARFSLDKKPINICLLSQEGQGTISVHSQVKSLCSHQVFIGSSPVSRNWYANFSLAASWCLVGNFCDCLSSQPQILSLSVHAALEHRSVLVIAEFNRGKNYKQKPQKVSMVACCHRPPCCSLGFNNPVFQWCQC